MFQTPAPRGGVPLNPKYDVQLTGTWFQTPAPRGGVPLKGAGYIFHSRNGQGFKPLRLGAVFLCQKVSGGDT